MCLINYLRLFIHRISGDSNVVSLNLDDNGIRTIVMNPFEYFMNLQELSIANNKITDLTKGEHKFFLNF